MPHGNAERHALRRGEVITKRMRRKSTGEEFWVEVKLSWDRLYYSCDGCKTWHKTATEAHEALLHTPPCCDLYPDCLHVVQS